MKNIVVNDEYHQADLKPSVLLDEYIDLLKKDVLNGLAQGDLIKTACPACRSSRTNTSFEKFSFTYHECADCQSLYVALRPGDARISSFYREAPSKVFWRNQLSEASRSQRKAKIIKPRFEWIIDSAAEYLPHAKHWVDVHTGQQRYLQAMAQTTFERKTTLFPYGATAAIDGIAVVDKPWWEAGLNEEADIISLFEVMDHASDVEALFASVRRMLKKDGLCFITNILASGFDIKELGREARNIYPPDRLNVLSAKGLNQLLERHGFECLEFSTPGILDVEIVLAALREDPSRSSSPFVRDLILNSTDDIRLDFQEFLQRSLLSSYGRILIRKV